MHTAELSKGLGSRPESTPSLLCNIECSCEILIAPEVGVMVGVRVTVCACVFLEYLLHRCVFAEYVSFRQHWILIRRFRFGNYCFAALAMALLVSQATPISAYSASALGKGSGVSNWCPPPESWRANQITFRA